MKSDERKVENEAPTVGSVGVETDERRMENGEWGVESEQGLTGDTKTMGPPTWSESCMLTHCRRPFQ